MKTYEVKTYRDGWERVTVRGLHCAQMIALEQIFKNAAVSYKKFTYVDGHFEKVDWVDSSDGPQMRNTMCRIERLSGALLKSMPKWINKTIIAVVQEINDQVIAALDTERGK